MLAVSSVCFSVTTAPAASGITAGKVVPTGSISSWYDSGVRLTWEARGGTSGYHRMAGRLTKPKPFVNIAGDAMFLDESAAIAAQAFPISEDELIKKAREYLFYGQGTEKPELLADEFVFMGPYVGGAGGLPRADYLKAVGGFNLKDAFPDLNPRFHHFRADPMDAGRVWFTSQASGTDAGTGFLGNAPTGKTFETPPQACSIKFNEQGLVIKYTIGHVMERSIGNTGGLGGIFGPAYAIGKPLPFPEARPWKPSKRYRVVQMLGQLVAKLSKKN